MDYKNLHIAVKQQKLKRKRTVLTGIAISIAFIYLFSLTPFMKSKQTSIQLYQHNHDDIFTILLHLQSAIKPLLPWYHNKTSGLESHLPMRLNLDDDNQGNWKTVTVQPNDNLAMIFQKLNLSSKTLSEIINIDENSSLLNRLHPGDKLRISIRNDGSLGELIYPLSTTEELIIYGVPGQYTSRINSRIQTQRTHAASTMIENSLYIAAERIHLPQKIIQQLTSIFSWHIDFARDIRFGDRFSVIYSEFLNDDGSITPGDIIAAKFSNRGDTYVAISYRGKDGETDYYSPTGENNRKAFLRYPAKYSHISSPFDLSRMHPILDVIRPHLGVDLAASLGTPVKATGDGKIVFRGVNGGYGNMIKIEHPHGITTLYAHLLNFNPAFKLGSKVKQGDVIANVGQSGLATGPHVHYEVHINGKPVDPVTTRLPKAEPIDQNHLADYLEYAHDILLQLEDYD
jgi:murein DD-endopeptidase MepM/ murein hydrolase activator NlpD